MWLIVAMLGLAATGITWSQKAGANVDAVVSALDWKEPKVDAALLPESPGAGQAASPVHADRVIAAARAEGLTGPLVLRPPTDAGEGWRVSERWVEWRTASVPGLPDVPSWRIAAGPSKSGANLRFCRVVCRGLVFHTLPRGFVPPRPTRRRAPFV